MLVCLGPVMSSTTNPMLVCLGQFMSSTTNPIWLKVIILPTGKVTYNGGKINYLMEKILHYGDKILTSKSGPHQLGPLINLKCLSIPNYHSWIRWNFYMCVDSRITRFFIHHTGLQFRPRFRAIVQSLKETKKRILKST